LHAFGLEDESSSGVVIVEVIDLFGCICHWWKEFRHGSKRELGESKFVNIIMERKRVLSVLNYYSAFIIAEERPNPR
jgi:hypothetical protein